MKKTLGVLFLIITLPNLAFATLPFVNTKVRDNGANESKIVIMLIASAYDATEQATASTNLGTINTNLFVSSGGTPDKNALYTNEASFNVYRITVEAPTSGTKLTLSEIQAVVTDTTVTPNYIFVRHNIAVIGGQDGYNGYINSKPCWEFYGNDQAYQPNHEIAHFIDSSVNSIVSIADEYTGNGTCLGRVRYAFNMYDSPVADKWSYLVATTPSQGGEYCTRHVWRPEANTWMFDAATNTGYGVVVAKVLDLSIKKHTKIASTETTAPTLTVSGITSSSTVSGLVPVQANASDASGIDKVEFYVQRYDGIHYEGTWLFKGRKISRLVKNAAGDAVITPANIYVGPGSNLGCTASSIPWPCCSGPEAGTCNSGVNTNIAWGASTAKIGGSNYEVSSDPVGLALTGTVQLFYWGAWALDVGTDSTVHIVAATLNNTSPYYSTYAAALAGINGVTPADNHARMGTIIIQWGDNSFTPGTTPIRRDWAYGGILIDSYLQWDWKTYLYPNGPYAISIIAYDENWNVAQVNTTNITVNNPIVGKGCTSLYVIDDDCDGYGVGSELGPDADDNDINVNTPDTVNNAETLLKARFAIVSGKADGGIIKWLVIDPVNGTDTDPGSARTSKNTLAEAVIDSWVTFAGAVVKNAAGTAIVYREGPDSGDYICDVNGTCGSLVDGTANNPVYVTIYPGEKITFYTTHDDHPLVGGGNCATLKSYWTFDGIGGGLIFKGAKSTRTGNGFTTCYSDHFIIREVEISESGRGSHSHHCMTNLLFERNSVHSSTSEHLIYWGAGPVGFALGTAVGPIDGIVFRENLLYSSVSHGLKINGIFYNITIDSNKFSLTGNANIDFDRGGSDILITNNIFGDLRAIDFSDYGGYGSYMADIGAGFTNYPKNNILVENNTFYHGMYDPRFEYSGGLNPWPFINYTTQFDGSQAPTWQANHDYDAVVLYVPHVPPTGDNEWVSPTTPTGCIYAAYIAGESGPTEPANWPTISGQLLQETGCSPGPCVKWLSDCISKISNHIYRNNIFVASGTASTDTLFRIGGAGQVITGFLGLNTPLIEHNLFYQTNSSKMILVYPSLMTLGEVQASETYNPYWGNNTWSNPLFTDVNNSYYLTPWKVNTTTSTSSPAKNLGIATGMPTDDIKGVTRVGYDAGAYEIGGDPTPTSFTGGSFSEGVMK